MAGPLAGYRVLDLSRILAGPWLAQLLSDLGAEVWKIERPGTGDDTRQWGPPFLRKDGGIDTTESAYFLSANRGKHSICVDISTDEGSAIVRALAQQADLVIENYKVGDMSRYGLDYEALKRVKPDIIYCSITGYGQTGPMKDVAGYDMAIQAIGGLIIVYGNLPDPCSQVEHTEIKQDGSNFIIKLSATPDVGGPAVDGCIKDPFPFKMGIPLNVVDLPAGSDSVTVNGSRADFKLDTANSTTSLRTADMSFVKAEIQVDSVNMDIGVGTPIPIHAVVSANLPNACAQLGEVRVHRDEISFIIRLVAYVPAQTAIAIQIRSRSASKSR